VRYKLYKEQIEYWPSNGRHILAHYDDDSIVVYQPYRQSIASFAIEHQKFGGEFSFQRMSWIKPNFLWMMYRSGWATKDGQEFILGIRIRRSFFDEVLKLAVPSSYEPSKFSDREEWKRAVSGSDVRLQWDPDHAPSGRPLERKAVQLGLRGEILRRYGLEEIISITDMTPFVIKQRLNLDKQYIELMIPEERVYEVSS